MCRGCTIYIGPAGDCTGRGKTAQKLMEGIGVNFLHGNVEKALVSRHIQILEGPWGHLITGGRPHTRRGHSIVRLRRLTVIIGHGCSLFFFPVQRVPL